MITFANVWDLLNPFRTIASGFELQKNGDVTHKASLAAVNTLGFGVNMLGGKAAPWTFTLVGIRSCLYRCIQCQSSGHSSCYELTVVLYLCNVQGH